MTPETLALITKFSLIGIFALILLGTLIAGVIGWKKGIWRSTYKMMFMFTLVLLAAVLLKPLSQALADMPLSFLPFRSIKIINQTTGEYIYVSISTFEKTIKECAAAYYYVNHLPYTYTEIASLSVAIADTAVKFAYVVISMLLVAVLGSLLQCILWHLLFKRIVPKACERLVKIKWLAMIEGAVSFALLAVLFISPLSSMVNIANYNYQRKELVSDNETVKYVDAFLNEYNNSIIGKLYGLTADENGLTFDAKMLDWITTSQSGDQSFSLFKELSTLTDIGLIYASALAGNTYNVSIKEILTDENIETLFNSISESEFLTSVIPIVAQIAFNLDVVKQNIDFSMVNLTKEDFVNDLGNIEKFFKAIAASGVIDDFLNPDGTFKTEIKIDTPSLILGIITNEERTKKFLGVFDSARDSEFLDMLIPSAMMMLANSSPEIARFLPQTWDEMNCINWGHEFGILFSSFSKLANIDQSIIDVLFSGSNTSTLPKANAAGGEVEVDNKLLGIVLDNVTEIGEIIFGKSESNGTPIDVDKYGVTNNIDKDFEKYCLLDGQLAKYYSGSLLELIGNSFVDSMNETEKANTKNKVNKVINDLSDPTKWRKNFKSEFANVFDVLEEICEYDNILEVLQKPEGIFNDFTAIDDELIQAMSNGMKQMDESNFLYATLAEMLKNSFTNGDISGLNDLGIDVNEITDGFDECIDNKTLGKELAFVFDNIKDFGVLQELSKDPEPIEALGGEAQYAAIANSLDVLYLSNIFNASYSGRGNYFNALEKIFEIANQSGLEFKEYLKDNADIQWHNNRIGNKINPDAYNKNINYDKTASDGTLVRGENGNIALAFATISDTEIIDLFSKEGFSLDDLTSNSNRSTIKNVLTACSRSKVMSATLGGFLDLKLDGQGLIDEDSNFENVIDWADEAIKLDNILGSIGTLNLDLADLDITSVTDVVALNDMLHNLANSSIFVKHQEQGVKYTFNSWLFGKLKESLNDGNNNLLNDPEIWLEELWGEKIDSTDDFSIARFDFMSLSEKEDWICSNYKTFNYSSYGNENDYFKNPDFYKDYFLANNYAAQDEIGRIVEIVYWMSCKEFDVSNITSVSPNVLRGALNAVNNSDTLRMIIYNAFDSINDTIKKNSDVFSLDQGRVEFLINGSIDKLGSILGPDDSRDARANEIECVIDLFKVYKSDVSEIGNIAALKGNVIDSDTGLQVSKIEIIANGFKSLINSKVYHGLGPKDEGELTSLQYSLKILYENDTFNGLLYNSNSEKDINQSNKYNAFKSDYMHMGKGEYIIRDFYKFGNGVDYKAECDEVDLIFDSIDCILDLADSSGNINFDSIELNTTNINILRNFLKEIDLTETLYDVVSNTFFKVFNERSYDNFGVDMTAADPFFMYSNAYDVYSKGDYSNRVTSAEIDRIMDIMAKYNSVDFDKLTNLSDAGSEIEKLSEITKLIHDSYMMHKLNENNDIGLSETIFEQMIHKMIRDTQLENTAAKVSVGNMSDEVTSRIKQVSLMENTKAADTSLTGSYATKWFDEGNGEADFIFEFFSFLADNDLSSANSLDLNKLNPTLMNNIMTKLNSIYISHNALASVLKDGFGSIGLANMTTYKGVDKADYVLSQKTYGGSDPSEAKEGTQIFLLRTILNATYDEDKQEYINLGNDIAQAISEDSSLLATILKFVDESPIYNVLFIDNNYQTFGKVDVKSLFMYNTFDNAGLSRYISGYNSSNADYSKYVGIAVINKIFNFKDENNNRLFNSEEEANTLSSIISKNNDGSINGIDSTNIAETSNKDLIVGIISSTYELNGDMYDVSNYTRHYFASEIVAGILEDVLENEYISIRNSSNVFDYVSNPDGVTSVYVSEYGRDINFKAKVSDGNLDTITPSSYDLLNEVEKNGLDGGLSLLADLSKSAPVYNNVDIYFAMMGASGKEQSKIATTYYISRIGKYIKIATDLKAGFPLNTWSGFVANPLADNSFSFESYGQKVKNFLGA